jgi:hypothetical protein
MKTVLLLTSVALLALTSASNAQIILDPGFADQSAAPGTIAIPPTGTIGSPWAFTNPIVDGEGELNQSGIAPNGTQNMDDAPSGQAGFLQDVSTISQTIHLTSDANVSLTFDWEGRIPVTYDNGSITTGENTITVMLGGITLFTGTPNTLTYNNIGKFQSETTAAADFSAGFYTLTFSGASSGVLTHTFTDNMTFIDNIQVNTSPVPEPSTSGLMALGGLTLFALFRRLKRSQG